MICTKCGAELPTEAVHCPSCGEKVEQDVSEQQQNTAAVKPGVIEAEQSEPHISDHTEVTYTPYLDGESEEKTSVTQEEEMIETEESAETEHAVTKADSVEEPKPFSDVPFQFSPVAKVEEKKEKKVKVSKTPVVAGIILGVAVLAVISAIATSILGIENPKKTVQKAVENTQKILQQQLEEASMPFGEGVQNGYEIEYTISEMEFGTPYGSVNLNQWLGGDIHFSMNGAVEKDLSAMSGIMAVGMGDMKDIRLSYAMKDDDFYWGVPDLYEKSFRMSQEEISDQAGTEFNLSMYDAQMTKAAIQSIQTTYMDGFFELLDVSTCTNIGEETLIGVSEVKASIYQVTVPVEVYKEYIQTMPDRIQSNEVFMDWLVSITSQSTADQLINSLREKAGYEYEADITDILLCYIYVDKKNQMVKCDIPMEEDGTTGQISFSVLGEKTLSDYMMWEIEGTDEDGPSVFLSAIMDRQGVNPSLYVDFHMDEAEQMIDLNLNLSYMLDSEPYSYSGSYHLLMTNDYNEYGGEFSMGGGLKGSMLPASEVVIPEEEYVLDIENLSSEEEEQIFYIILQNIKDGGYLPSQYMAMVEYLLEDNGLEYGEDSYDPEIEMWDDELWSEELDYDAESGLPILRDYDKQYQIELIGPTDSVLDEEWSSNEYLCYEKDENIYIYTIDFLKTDTEDYFANEREIYQDSTTYQNVIFSDIQMKTINGYQVFYQSCTYESFGEKYAEYYAWVRLDPEKVFSIYCNISDYNSEDSILDDCFFSSLPQ